MQLHVTLRCKPVVKQYLINKYGEQLQLPDDDWIKLLIIHLLIRNSAKDDTDCTLEKYSTQARFEFNYFTAEAKLPIIFSDYEKYGDYLTKTATRAINNRIEDIIHQQLYQHLEFYVHVAKYRLKDAIAMFQQIYNFPEDIYTGDSIKKYYQRKIQPFLIPQKFSSVNVSFKKKKSYRRAA